jgi:uncharacterized membrane protein HdeD (DUF308 family)
MDNPFPHSTEPTVFTPVDVDGVQHKRGWFIALGLTFVVLGVLSILLPFAGSLFTTLAIGWLLVVGGAVQGVHAIQNRQWAHSGWALVGAAIMVIAGALVVMYPLAGTLTLTLILSAYFLAEGIVKIVRALQHRTMHAWGWLLCDGILALVLGALLWARWPSSAVWALGLLVGINFLFGGSSLLLIALGTWARVPARP